MTESPIDPDKAATATRLDRQALESAVVSKALIWRANMNLHDAATDLAKAVDEFVQFNLAHPDVSSPARAAAGPDPEARLSAAPGPAVSAEALRPGAFPLCAPRNPATPTKAPRHDRTR